MNAFIKLGVIEPLAQALYQQGIRFPTVIQQASIPAIIYAAAVWIYPG